MKRVLVTGCSQGLGLVTAEHLLRGGWQVTAVQRSTSAALDQLQLDFPEQLRIFQWDLTQTQGLEEQFRDCWYPDNQPVHGLVNDAAMAYDDLISNLDLGRLSQMMLLNVQAPMALSRAVIRRLLLHRQGGSLVHVSSICAHTGYKGLAMYAATKGAVEAFSRTLAREWGSRQIRSNCVVPGFMETPMSQSLDAAQRERIFRRTALNAPTSPSSVAATIAFLLSDLSGSVTGQNFIVDAGSL